MKLIGSIFPILLTKYKLDDIKLFLDLEDFEQLQKEYDEMMYIKARFNSLKGTVLEPTQHKNNMSKSESGFFPVEALRQGSVWPAEVDPVRREDFLSPEDFFAVFKMSKEEFACLDKFKRVRIKKEVMLF
jgi:hypothetical protein